MTASFHSNSVERERESPPPLSVRIYDFNKVLLPGTEYREEGGFESNERGCCCKCLGWQRGPRGVTFILIQTFISYKRRERAGDKELHFTLHLTLHAFALGFATQIIYIRILYRTCAFNTDAINKFASRNINRTVRHLYIIIVIIF